ncbi:hypothetical protein ABT317_39930, partial [Streptomyces carpinensis]
MGGLSPSAPERAPRAPGPTGFSRDHDGGFPPNANARSGRFEKGRRQGFSKMRQVTRKGLMTVAAATGVIAAA